MKKNLALAFVVLLALGCATSGTAAPGSSENPAAISWRSVRQEKDSTSIKGSVRASFGLFTFTWCIDAQGSVTLADEEPSGTGEMPIYNKTLLYPWIPGDGKVYLFRIRMPVLNSHDPVSVHLVTVVWQTELFSGLSAVTAKRSEQKYPDGLVPEASVVPVEITKWGESGFFWDMNEKGQQRLFRRDSDGIQKQVYPWMKDSETGKPQTSLVFEIARHTIDDLSMEFLICHAWVDAAQLLSAR